VDATSEFTLLVNTVLAGRLCEFVDAKHCAAMGTRPTATFGCAACTVRIIGELAQERVASLRPRSSCRHPSSTWTRSA
jgi:hypothetical protein